MLVLMVKLQACHAGKRMLPPSPTDLHAVEIFEIFCFAVVAFVDPL